MDRLEEKIFNRSALAWQEIAEVGYSSLAAPRPLRGDLMNRSSLADAEICRDCGRCCRSFRIWVDHKSGAADRLALLSGARHEKISQESFAASDLVEVQIPCEHHIAGRGCAIYGMSSRPRLCSDFPDNLFNRDDTGALTLTDAHAVKIIALYSDYCPAVARVGRTPPAVS